MRGFKRFSVSLFVMFVLFTFFSCTPADKGKPVEIDTLVISSRNHTRMQPEIFYAFKHAEKEIGPLLEMDFVIFNPFQYKVLEEGVKFQNRLKEFWDLLNKCVVEVVAIKKANPHNGNKKYNIQ